MDPAGADDAGVRDLLRAAVLCNDATLVAPPAPPAPAVAWSITGDPTEGALLALAAKGGLDLEAVRAANGRVAELGFDAARQRMTTVHEAGDGVLVVCKGAPEVVVPLLAAGDRDVGPRALAAADQLAADGYRVLALAERRLATAPARIEDEERELHLLGLVAMADPPREAAAGAIAACRSAGITLVMITGDHLLTASAIARRLGILDDDRVAVTGRELAAMDPRERENAVDRIAVYARTARTRSSPSSRRSSGAGPSSR